MAADDKWRLYEMAVRLLEHDTQNQWALFATFFVPQAVLLGLALQSLSSDPTKTVYLAGSIQPAYAVGVFGLVLAIPTLITHARSNLIARLRIREALAIESQTDSSVFREGLDLVQGRRIKGLRLPWYMRYPSNNTVLLRALILLWAAADAVIALTHEPSGWIAPAVVVALSLVNVYLAVDSAVRGQS
ncbi:MAG TPA: hypothetical protein VN973_06030 [Candidatus Dormibacteraeota bacterium]|nr:hypothetical protein [Candidatus Dormibacteraeota bacterium]